MLFYVNKDTDETYSEKAFTEKILKPEVIELFKEGFDEFLENNYYSLWLHNEFYYQPTHIQNSIRKKWFKKCLENARNGILRDREEDAFAEINTKYLDYK